MHTEGQGAPRSEPYHHKCELSLCQYSGATLKETVSVVLNSSNTESLALWSSTLLEYFPSAPDTDIIQDAWHFFISKLHLL